MELLSLWNMPRKKPVKQEDITPSLLKFREKRKWQISLRRYVIQKSLCPQYAPYFGLDIENIRRWFECQFKTGQSWESFGLNWQFDHVIPVTYFDFSEEAELQICWNFTNLRVEPVQQQKDRGAWMDILAAKHYFRELYTATRYEPCHKLLLKIGQIEITERASTDAQQKFINEHLDYLQMIDGYTAFEFELLNSGRHIEDVRKEIALLSRLGKPSPG